MIGFIGILQDLFPLVVLGVLGLAIWLIVRAGGKWWKHAVVLVLLLAFILLGYGYITSIASGVRGFYFLKTIRPEQVEAISVGGMTISDPSALRDFSSALHHLQWFSSSHGGWAKELPLHIRLKNGDERTFALGLYLRRRGVVFHGTSRTRWSYRNYDCGFSAELPDVLTSMKIALPTSR